MSHLADLFCPWFRSQEWNGVASLPLEYHLEHSFKERPRGSPHGERVVRQGVAHLAEAVPLQVHGLNVLIVAGGAVARDHRDGGEDLFQREEDVWKLLGFLEAKCLRFHFFQLSSTVQWYASDHSPKRPAFETEEKYISATCSLNFLLHCQP